MFQPLEISGISTSLSLREGCLKIHSPTVQQETSFPLCDISAVMISEPAITLSGMALAELAKRKIPVIVCNAQHIPIGILSPADFSGDSAPQVVAAQFASSCSFQKRIWKMLIQSKVMGQSAILKEFANSDILEPISRTIRNDNAAVSESRAAAVYWKTLNVFPKRDRFANDANKLFNYAYTVLYAVFAREIACAGLFMQYGVWHHNHENPCCLASDLMESFRPCIDQIVLKILRDFPNRFPSPLTLDIKNEFFRRLYNFQCVSDAGKVSLFYACKLVTLAFRTAVLEKDYRKMRVLKWNWSGHVACCFI